MSPYCRHQGLYPPVLLLASPGLRYVGQSWHPLLEHHHQAGQLLLLLSVFGLRGQQIEIQGSILVNVGRFPGAFGLLIGLLIHTP